MVLDIGLSCRSLLLVVYGLSSSLRDMPVFVARSTTRDD
jgi:hypothetical protein